MGAFNFGATPTSGFSAMTIAPQLIGGSNNATINALAELSWTGNVGQAATVTYSFNSPYPGHSIFSSAQQANTRLALQAWADIANITFVEVSGDANIDFGIGDLSSLGEDVAGVAYMTWNGTQITDVDISMDDEMTGDYHVGGSAYETLLHEIGHAIGFKHPFEDTPTLPTNLDNSDFTVMSYTPGSGTPITPMLGDIAAAQYLYGANTTKNSGDSVYTFSLNDYTSRVIWDVAGNDLIDISNIDYASTVDLRQGYAYKSQIGANQVWIGEGVTIESVLGTRLGDLIHGSSIANRLFGNTGVDTISGNEGDDTICGGANFTDTADVGDTIFGNAGNDIIYGNAGNDIIYGGSSLNDSAETGNDILYGGLGDDTLYGNGGNDTIVGASGNDYIYGGAGDDHFVITWGSGNDVILPFQGAGVDGGDVLKVFANVNHTGITTAYDVLARAVTDGEHHYVDLGEGNSALILFTYGNLSAGDILII